MESTLTELRRETTKTVRPVLAGEEVIITEHGQPKFKIVPVRGQFDRAKAFKYLKAIGPVEFLPRK